jgi:transitional endoplasmic reticulum ATPase
MYAGSSHVTESVVSQILTELDGLEELKNVVVLAATNRPDMLDEALLRPGRLDRVIYVPPPDTEGRKKIFAVYLTEEGPAEQRVLSADIDTDELVQRTEGFVGADIEALVREAKLFAMREFVSTMTGKSEQEMKDAIPYVKITRKHFEEAFHKVKPSLDRESLEEAERKAWEMIYGSEEQKVLEEALSVVKRAEIALAGKEERNLKKGSEELRTMIFRRPKDFREIEKMKKKVEEFLEKKQKIPHAVAG